MVEHHISPESQLPVCHDQSSVSSGFICCRFVAAGVELAVVVVAVPLSEVVIAPIINNNETFFIFDFFCPVSSIVLIYKNTNYSLQRFVIVHDYQESYKTFH